MKKIKEKVVGDPSKIQSKVFETQPSGMAATESEMMSPVTVGEFGKTASTIKGVEKTKPKKLDRGSSVSSLGGMRKTNRPVNSRGSTREGRSKKPGSASSNRGNSEMKRNRTLTPTARRTTKPDKFPKPEPISPEEQAIFDEKRE